MTFIISLALIVQKLLQNRSRKKARSRKLNDAERAKSEIQFPLYLEKY